jgi:hypothetical protein
MTGIVPQWQRFAPTKQIPIPSPPEKINEFKVAEKVKALVQVADAEVSSCR